MVHGAILLLQGVSFVYKGPCGAGDPECKRMTVPMAVRASSQSSSHPRPWPSPYVTISVSLRHTGRARHRAEAGAGVLLAGTHRGACTWDHW